MASLATAEKRIVTDTMRMEESAAPAAATTTTETVTTQTTTADANVVKNAIDKLLAGNTAAKAADTKKWYQKPMVWVGIGLVVVGLGYASYKYKWMK